MIYEAKNFEKLLGTKGFSDQLLNNHFALYQGYVANLNKLSETLRNMVKEGKIITAEYAELKRRFGWEWNGMRLHEYYFGNIVKDGKEIDKKTNLYKKIVQDFGSYEGWEKDFKATGVMRGIGWVILYYDVFEHAYMIDYGLKRADYVDTFFKAIDWSIDPIVDALIK